MFDTIHHIAIIGSDYEKSKHFYVDLLGLKVIRENYRKERDDYKIDLVCGPQEIELFIIKTSGLPLVFFMKNQRKLFCNFVL